MTDSQAIRKIIEYIGADEPDYKIYSSLLWLGGDFQGTGWDDVQDAVDSRQEHYRVKKKVPLPFVANEGWYGWIEGV